MGIFDELMAFYKNGPAKQINRLEKEKRRSLFREKVRVFFSDANEELGGKICQELQIGRGKAEICFWANNDVRVKIQESVKGCHCFVLGSYHGNSNIRHAEITAIIRACRDSGAEKIIAVIPFLGYMKQEKIKEGREVNLAKLHAEEICNAGANSVVVIDLHADAIQGFFNVPVSHLRSLKSIINVLKKDEDFQDPDKVVCVSPDAGAVARAMKFIHTVFCWLAIIFKYRPNPYSVDTTAFLGTVKDKIACILDDLIQSGTTLVESAIKLIEKGARKIIICVVHGDWCGNAVENMTLMMRTGAVDKFYITNTTPLPEKICNLPNIHVISVVPMLAEAIRRIYMETSLSSLSELNRKKRKIEHIKPVSLFDRLRTTFKKYRPNNGINWDQLAEEIKKVA